MNTGPADDAVRKLEIVFETLALALEDHAREVLDYYLDTQTGEVIELPAELLEDLEYADDAAAEDLDGWDETLLTAARCIAAEAGPDDPIRYVWVPQRESYEAYGTMVRFAEGVESRELQRLLSVALNGRGAFRRFKDVLYDYPDERERWFQMNNAELRAYAADWLRTLGIEAQEAAAHPV